MQSMKKSLHNRLGEKNHDSGFPGGAESYTVSKHFSRGHVQCIQTIHTAAVTNMSLPID